jgi:hypothetical protein
LRKYSIEPHVIICLLVEEVLLSISSTERQIITSWGSIEYFLNWVTNYHMRFYWVFFSQLKYSIEPHVIICLSVEEVHNRTSCDNLSTERKIITWGSIEYFLNWETNYHKPHVIIFLSVEEVLNRISCDNLSLSWGSTQ